MSISLLLQNLPLLVERVSLWSLQIVALKLVCKFRYCCKICPCFCASDKGYPYTLLFQVPNAGGGSGGSLWITCGTFNGAGSIEANGGAGNYYGGGGAGGIVTVNYQTGVFHSDQTIAKGGSAGGKGASEPGGPGIVFLNGAVPLNRNLRIDNKGLQAKVGCRILFIAME